MKTNIIIGRFQVDSLTAGHRHFIDSVIRKRKNAQLVFFIGAAPYSYNTRTPIPPPMIAKMLKFHYPCIVKIIPDNPSDEIWSQQIDREASKYKNPVLFGSRDSFIPRYYGKLKCIEIKQLQGVSGSARRKQIASNYSSNSPHFRAGIIHAVENRFPTAYATVDIAVINNTMGSEGRGIVLKKQELLLGRKPGRTQFCFIGGFVDSSDESLEAAAWRELNEEVKAIQTHEVKYIGSTKVDDFRYRGTKDGIITSLFVTYKLGGGEMAADDLEEVKWFDLANFDMSVLSEYHHPLLKMLKNHLKL